MNQIIKYITETLMQKSSDTKPLRFSKRVEGFTEEVHVYSKGDFLVGSECEYTPFFLERKFNNASPVSIYYKGQCIAMLNSGNTYAYKVDMQADLRVAKKMVSYIIENNIQADLYVDFIEESTNGQIAKVS